MTCQYLLQRGTRRTVFTQEMAAPQTHYRNREDVQICVFGSSRVESGRGE